jgi:two-component system LytT family response regulator
MEQKLSALIVDDEAAARKLLKKLLEETLFFHDIRHAHSAAAANIELAHFEPDLIFLDIKMPGKDGFTLIDDFKRNFRDTEIIIVTAYDHYAIKAVRNHAFDYLLKPVNRKELKQSVVRFIELKKNISNSDRLISTTNHIEKIQRIRINTRSGILFINPASILYCKADGNYTTICTGTKQHLCSMNIGRIEELLPGNGFIRIGRSYIINFEFITLLDRKESTITLVREGESVSLKIPRLHMKDLDIM